MIRFLTATTILFAWGAPAVAVDLIFLDCAGTLKYTNIDGVHQEMPLKREWQIDLRAKEMHPIAYPDYSFVLKEVSITAISGVSDSAETAEVVKVDRIFGSVEVISTKKSSGKIETRSLMNCKLVTPKF